MEDLEHIGKEDPLKRRREPGQDRMKLTPMTLNDRGPKVHLSPACVLLTVYLTFLPIVASPVASGSTMRVDRASASSSTTGLTFGSQAVLEACWSQEELRGKPGDKSVVRPALPAERKPPERTTPKRINPQLEPGLRNSIRHVKLPEHAKFVALTFDLCERERERTGYDAEIVNFLRTNGIKATFFAGGKWMRTHADKAMQLMADPLFEVGNHAWTHGNFRMLDLPKMEEQILWTQAQYEQLWEELQTRAVARQVDPSEMEKIPRVPSLFRFPYGTCNSQALDLLARYGLAAIQWDVVTGDAARGQTAQAITRVVLQQTKPGSIIICHANGRGHGTSQALPVFVPKLRESGYQFVTVSELLSYGSAVASKDCYELNPGDNLRYDRKVGAGME
jgi:peptidoglycan/xylan/chitin deacetylase (PgdA/CDA1 family)